MSLTVVAPEGSHFAFEEVKTAKGTKTLGDVPLLVWDSAVDMVGYYGEEAVLAMADGTSFRVSFQNIARRGRASNKSDDDIAKAQIDFRPGKRTVGASTPASRAASAARRAADKGLDGDALAKLLDRIASGDLPAELRATLGV
jgi:hypothetical protein